VQFPPIPQDDLLDVMELTNSIESHTKETLKDTDLHLAMSALIGSSVNGLVALCNNKEEFVLYANIFTQVLLKMAHKIQTSSQ